MTDYSSYHIPLPPRHPTGNPKTVQQKQPAKVRNSSLNNSLGKRVMTKLVRPLFLITAFTKTPNGSLVYLVREMKRLSSRT